MLVRASANMSNRDFAISNRLHRAGAIDFNVEFPTRHAAMLKDTKGTNGKRLFQACQDTDGLSVCEGEPIYTPKRFKGNHYTSVDSCRNPIGCISSLNGFSQGLVSKDQMFKRDARGSMSIKMTGSSLEDAKTAIMKHERVRDMFFKEVHPMGVSVSKWQYSKLGHQQDQYVGTLGGMNTIYCDTDCQAGDILVVDMPFPTEPEVADLVDEARPGTSTPTPWGFVKCVNKKGTPREKVTLVVRPLPDLPNVVPSPDENIQRRLMHEVMRSNFERRGQILGKCTRGAKKGERVDLCLQANAIGGSVNMNDSSSLLALLFANQDQQMPTYHAGVFQPGDAPQPTVSGEPADKR